jgi:hypothetical protein
MPSRAEVRASAEEAIRLREAVPGMPHEGPYPASVEEVADELVRYIAELDQTSAQGVAALVAKRLQSETRGSRMVCLVCGRYVAANRNGKMAMHGVAGGTSSSCPGTGLTLDQARPGITNAESEQIRWGHYRR